VPQLGLGHAPVQRQGGDEVYVVDAGRRGLVEHGLDHALADIGPAHRRQRERDVVEGDRQPHARPEQIRQRPLVAERLAQRPPDGGVRIPDGGQRFGRVDDAGALGGEPFEPEPLAVVVQDRRGRVVDVEDEAGAGHQRLRSFS
jgi:hypothetical protein